MPNLQQNNETEHINKETILLQELLKKNGKSQNGLMQIGKIRVKTGKSTDIFQMKKIRNVVRNIFENKIKQIKKNANLLKNTLAHVKKERGYLKKD